MPERIQRKRTRGWKMPPNTTYVGRPTKWGNPYTLGEWTCASDDEPNIVEINTQQDIVDLFETYTIPELLDDGLIEELRGKNLACWCKLGEPCHADVLLRLANNPMQATLRRKYSGSRP